MKPSEVETRGCKTGSPEYGVAVAQIEALVDIAAPALDAEFAADVAACAAAAHRIEDALRCKEANEVTDEFAAAIPRIVATAVVAGVVPMVQARESRDRTGG